MKILLNIMSLFLISVSFAQENPVQWTSSIKRISDTEYTLVFKATIEKDWHLYSSYNPEGASLPIEFDSEQTGVVFDFVGNIIESKTHKEYNETWKKEEIFFVNTATLKQQIKLKEVSTKSIVITLYAQVCKKSCIPITRTFVFDLTTI